MSSREQDNRVSPANSRDDRSDEESGSSRSYLEPGRTLVKPRPSASGGAQSQDQPDDVPEHWKVGDFILDTYEVKAKLGEGAFGTVHKVHHKGWNTDLAVKSAKPPFDEEAIRNEAEVWMELGLHPNTVSCFFVRNLGGIPRIFVECVEGGTLDEWLYGKKELDTDGNERQVAPPRDLTRAQRLAIAIEICRGMNHAHTFKWKDKNGTEQEGFVHRDLKPANILMTEDGIPRITDFGLVHFGTRSAGRARNAIRDSPAEVGIPVEAEGATMVKSIREDGGLEGTPAYAAPEQWDGRVAVSYSADVYAFGIILYELFCGCRPFVLSEEFIHAIDEWKLSEYERMHREHRPPEPSSFTPDIDGDLASLMLHCLEKKPEARPANFVDIRNQLKAIYERLEDERYDALHPEPKAAELLADSLNNRALSYLEIGQPERAEDLWAGSLGADPHHVEATYNAGLYQWRACKTTDDDFVRRMAEVRASQSAEWKGDYFLGLIHLERGDGEAAIRVLDEAAKRSGGSREVTAALQKARALGPACVHFLEGHTKKVQSVALSSDGRWALSGSKDKTVRLWEVATGQCVRSFEGHTSGMHRYKGVHSLALSDDGQWALSAGGDNKLRLWETVNGQCVCTIDSSVNSVFLSRDGRRALSGADDHAVRLWEMATGRCVRTFEGHTNIVLCVTLSDDGRWALSGGGSSELLLWEVATGQRARVFKGHTGMVTSVALSADGHLALSASSDSTLRLWEAATGRCVHRFVGHESSVPSVSLSADGRWVLSGSHDTTLRLWEVATGRCVRTLGGGGDTYEVESVALSGDGHWAVSASLDGTLQLWETGLRIRPSKAPYVFCGISRGQEVLDDESRFHRLLAEGRQALACDRVGEGLVKAREARLIPGRYRNEESTALWNDIRLRLRSGAFVGAWQLRTIEEGKYAVTSAALTTDGQWALSAGVGMLRLWEVSTGRCVRAFEASVYSGCLSQDGRWVLSGGTADALRFWEVSTGRCVRAFRGHTEEVRCVALSADSRWALSGSNDKTLRLWEVATGRCVRVLEGHALIVASVVLSPDGRWALSASNDKTLRLWEISTGRCVHTMEGHAHVVTSVALSPNDRWALSGSSDKTLRLWDVVDGRCVRIFRGHAHVVTSVALSPDGRWALSGSNDKTLRLWEVSTGRCVRTFRGHTGEVKCVALSADSRWALSGSADRTCCLWEMDWELEQVDVADWDESARPHLRSFLTLHTPYAASLPADHTPSEEELTRALTREGTPTWNDEDFKQLLYTLGCAGYGWLRPEGVKRELEKMAADWTGPPPLGG